MTLFSETNFVSWASALSSQHSALSTQHSALISYWQVIHPPTSARRMFVHVLDENGDIVAQDDGLAAAALQPGDLIFVGPFPTPARNLHTPPGRL